MGHAPLTAPTDARAAPRPLTVVALAGAAVAVGHGFGRLTYPFVLPAMVDDLVGSYSRAGVLGMANLLAYLAGVLLVIRLSPRVALTRFIRVGLTGVIVGLAVLAVAPTYGVLLLGMALTGGFNAAIWVPASALITSVVPARHRGLAAGALGMGFGLAIVFAGQLTRVVQARQGDGAWRPIWAAAAAVGVVVLVAMTVGLRVRTAARPSGPPALSALRRLPGAAALIVSYAGFALGYVVFSSYLVAALRDDAGFSASHAAAVYSVVGLLGIVGGVVVGRVSDRLGRRNAIAGAHLLMAGSALAVLLGAEPWVVLAAASFGVFASGMPAVVAAYIADHLEAVAVAGALGFVTIAFGVSQTLGPPIGGWLADSSNAFTLTFLLSASAHVVGAAAALALPADAHASRPA
ncbi:MAG: MFS transporter [Acidimicrobiales bacterium]